MRLVYLAGRADGTLLVQTMALNAEVIWHRRIMATAQQLIA